MKKEIITCDCCGDEMPNRPDAYRGEFKANLPKDFRGDIIEAKFALNDICMKCADKILRFSETLKDGEQSRQADVMRSPPLEGLPENKPIYKDSGLWQMRSDDMEGVIIQQGVNESEDDFLKRCRDFHAEEMNQLLSNDGGGAA